MKKLRRFITSLLPLLIVVTLLAGNAQAALLDVGPTVPQVIGSSEPTLGHGFPLWYRDTNHLPLGLCTDQAMCFFAPPVPAPAAVVFPTNMPDEAFYWAAESIIALPGVGKQAILVQALEAAFSTGAAVPGNQVTFARMRIRIDTPIAGTYVATTPYKQFTFTIANDPVAIAAGIFFTEDIGIAQGGVYTGALAGSIGPFLYCANNTDPAKNAPVIRTTGTFLGDGLPCTVAGSTFLDPKTGQLANLFRVDGPLGSNLGGAGVDFVESRLFSVNGKIHTEVIPTPLTVDKATYALDSRGMQVNTFATTQPVSNKTIPGISLFPLNFALTGQASSLELNGAGIATQTLATNSPADGKFFSLSGIFNPAAVTFPAKVTVTNTADIPVTTKTVDLVDGVTITGASYNSTTSTLKVAAASADKLTASTLQVFQTDETVLPSKKVLLGTMTGGQLSLTFPATLALPAIPDGPGGSKLYNIPPAAVTVVSSLGGSDTAPVAVFSAAALPAATGAFLAANPGSPKNIGTPVIFVGAGQGGTGSYEFQFLVNNVVVQAFSSLGEFAWSTAALTPGAYTIRVNVRSTGSTAVAGEAFATVTYQLNALPPPAAAVIISPLPASPQNPGASVTFVAAASGGSGNYEYRFWRKIGAAWTVAQNYSPTATWTWNTTGVPVGSYPIQVDARNVGSTTATFEAAKAITYTLVAPAAPASAVTLASTLASPQTAGASITFVAAGSGGSGNYEYRFWRKTGAVWSVVQNYSTTATWTWNTTGAIPGLYGIQVDVRNVGSTASPSEAAKSIVYTIQ